MVKVSELGQLLRSLCFQARWKYAVFWKFRGRSQTLLEWEDGYCVPSGSRPGMSEEPWNGYFNGESGLISFSRGMNSLTGSSTPCPIELAVSSMSCHLYSLGEGIVGKVASSRNPRWVIPKTFTSKIPEELQPQFAAGIKFHVRWRKELLSPHCWERGVILANEERTCRFFHLAKKRCKFS